MIVRKSHAEREAMREGGRITAACLRVLAANIRPGVTTKELDALAEEFILSRGGTPEFKGYQGFPASICASPNAVASSRSPTAPIGLAWEWRPSPRPADWRRSRPAAR